MSCHTTAKSMGLTMTLRTILQVQPHKIIPPQYNINVFPLHSQETLEHSRMILSLTYNKLNI